MRKVLVNLTAASKAASDYQWYQYTGARKLTLTTTNGKRTSILKKGSKFGVRISHDGKQGRVVTEDQGLTIVFSMDKLAVNDLIKKADKIKTPKLTSSKDSTDKKSAKKESKVDKTPKTEKKPKTKKKPKAKEAGVDYDFKDFIKGNKPALNKLLKEHRERTGSTLTLKKLLDHIG